MFTGRSVERSILAEAIESREAELIAVTGRRRVGKTYLVRTACQKHLVFELSGVHNAALHVQLENFSTELKRISKTGAHLTAPRSWQQAFAQLRQHLETTKISDLPR